VSIPIVALSDVRVVYGGRDVLAVDALDVVAGETLSVIGPNGSGKSTLLRVMSLLEAPTAGEVRVHGRPVSAGRSLAERRRMASVFQHPLLADMTVAENVGLGLRFRHVDTATTADRVGHWLARLGIADFGQRRARTLSGGEAQRVALARAFAVEPELLLLDEPFASLDEPTRAALLVDLGNILRAERTTTVLVTHDRGEAQSLADRVAVLLGGRLQQVDETERVFRAPASEDVARFVGVETIVNGVVVAAADGVSVVEAAGRKVEVASPATVGERVRLCIRPEDVTLTQPDERAVLSSARNHLSGTVIRAQRTGAVVRVVVECGFQLVATVTARSAEDLALVEGAPITAVFKASAAHLIPARFA
jgi:tungstate transport system ATP-binding protein